MASSPPSSLASEPRCFSCQLHPAGQAAFSLQGPLEVSSSWLWRLSKASASPTAPWQASPSRSCTPSTLALGDLTHCVASAPSLSRGHLHLCRNGPTPLSGPELHVLPHLDFPISNQAPAPLDFIIKSKVQEFHLLQGKHSSNAMINCNCFGLKLGERASGPSTRVTAPGFQAFAAKWDVGSVWFQERPESEFLYKVYWIVSVDSSTEK